MGQLKTFLFLSAITLSASAFAQWQWIDKDGKKVFSDRAPPAEITDKNILKRPAGSKPMPAAAPAPTPGVSEAVPKISGVDPVLEEKKKQAEAVEANKKKQESDKLAKDRAENCLRAQQAKNSYDSGIRIARTNAQGEREILDDDARAADTKRLQSIIATDCR